MRPPLSSSRPRAHPRAATDDDAPTRRSHPYTVSNIPFTDAVDRVNQARTEQDEMHLVLRVNPTSGLGPRLLRLAESANPTTPVLLDGPYGGLVNRDLGRHDTVFLVAGGAGFSFSMAVLESLTERTLRGEAGINVTRLHVHWAVRNGGASPGRPSLAVPSAC